MFYKYLTKCTPLSTPMVRPLENADFRNTCQKDLKFGQCLDMGLETSHRKFGEIKCPSSHFIANSIINTPDFRGILRTGS